MSGHEVPGMRRRDRWSLRRRLARAWRRGLAERRAARVVEARLVQGEVLDALRRHDEALVSDAEMHLGGWALTVSRSHGPTLDLLAGALREGPVLLQGVTDHRRFFELCFRTVRGPLALLTQDLALTARGGGLRLLPPVPSLA